jgi:hypothetical protein
MLDKSSIIWAVFCRAGVVLFIYFVLLHWTTCLIIHFCCAQSEVTRRMEEMTVSKREDHNAEGTGVLPRAEIVRDEHPLSLGKTSVWNQYFQVWKLILAGVLPNLYYMLHSVVWTLKSIICIVQYTNGSWDHQTIFVMCSYAHNVQNISYFVFLQCEPTSWLLLLFIFLTLFYTFLKYA